MLHSAVRHTRHRCAVRAAKRASAAPGLLACLLTSPPPPQLPARLPLCRVPGGAPLARHVEDFLKVAICCRVAQGYGLTETCAASFIAVPDCPVSERARLLVCGA